MLMKYIVLKMEINKENMRPMNLNFIIYKFYICFFKMDFRDLLSFQISGPRLA